MSRGEGVGGSRLTSKTTPTSTSKTTPTAQAATLVDLPVELLIFVLDFLSYDELARGRAVGKLFDKQCGLLLNRGFRRLEALHSRTMQHVKAQLPRRESERRNHHFARHSDILTAMETRISLLSMTYSKFIEVNLCCFIPGKVLDELFSVLKTVNSSLAIQNHLPPRPHELLQELRDISSMAMEYFDEQVAPTLRDTAASSLNTGGVEGHAGGGGRSSSRADSLSLALIGAFRGSLASPAVGSASTSSSSSSLLRHASQHHATCLSATTTSVAACPSNQIVSTLQATVRNQARQLTELRKKSSATESKLKEQQRKTAAALEAHTKKMSMFAVKFDEMQRQMIKYESTVSEQLQDAVNTNSAPATDVVNRRSSGGGRASAKRKLSVSSAAAVPAKRQAPSPPDDTAARPSCSARVTRSSARANK